MALTRDFPATGPCSWPTAMSCSTWQPSMPPGRTGRSGSSIRLRHLGPLYSTRSSTRNFRLLRGCLETYPQGLETGIKQRI
jgi:hypothetical protein